jgi:hypothetical protein
MRHMSCQYFIDAGRLDEADEMLAVARSREADRMPTTAEHRIQALRGQEAEALAGAARIEQDVLAHAGTDDERVIIRTRMMEIRACFGRHEDALRDLEAVLAIERRADTQSYVGQALPTLIRAACNVGRIDLAEQILEEAARAPFPYSVHAHVAARALLAEHEGRLEDAVAGFHDAADRWASFTTPIEEAHARIGNARCLVALGRHAEALVPLASAREICERMGAKPMLADVASIHARLSSAAPA